jgi:hypothetical protein
MFSREVPDLDPWRVSENPECETCGRGIVVRLPGNVPSAECAACADEFDALNAAGKLELA